MWHTERSETGRFGSNGVKEAAGVAVEIISSVQNPKLRRERERDIHGHSCCLENVEIHKVCVKLSQLYTKMVNWSQPT